MTETERARECEKRRRDGSDLKRSDGEKNPVGRVGSNRERGGGGG